MNKRSARYCPAAAVSLITFAVYLTALGNEFVWDDYEYVLNNPHIRSLDPAFFRWAFFDFYSANWHPLAWISHALDYAAWGLDPPGHHLTGIIIHAINTFLVVALSMRLMDVVKAPSPLSSPSRGEDGPKSAPDHNAPLLKAPTVGFGAPSYLKRGKGELSAPPLHPLRGGDEGEGERGILTAGVVTGLLFGLHPLHVESVAWVAERKDVLCGLFYLLSVLSYLKYRSNKSYKTYLLCLTFFIFALLSKPMAVSLPVVLLVLDWRPLRSTGSWRTFAEAFAEKLPFFCFSLISSAITVIAQKTSGAMSEMELVPLWARLLVAAKAPGGYLLKMAWPVGLGPFYPYPRLHEITLSSPDYLLPVMALAGITAVLLILGRKRGEFLSAWLYYVAVLLPVIGIVQVGPQAMADRYTYLPSLGPFFLMGAGASWLWMKTDHMRQMGASVKPLFIAAGLALVVSMSYATVKQISFWRDPISFWGRVIEMAPGRVPLAYYNRGWSYKEKGQLDRALEDFTSAIALNPAVAAYTNRGIVFWQKGLLDSALQDFTEAIALDPLASVSYANRGLLLREKGEFIKALEDYGRALSLKPDFAEIYAARGDLYLATDETQQALMDYRSACELGSETGCKALKKAPVREGKIMIQ